MSSSTQLPSARSLDVRISARVEEGDCVRHFEVRAATFEDAHADLLRRLARAGYHVARGIEIAGTAS